MGRLIYSMSVSLDGFVETPSRSLAAWSTSDTRSSTRLDERFRVSPSRVNLTHHSLMACGSRSPGTRLTTGRIWRIRLASPEGGSCSRTMSPRHGIGIFLELVGLAMAGRTLAFTGTLTNPTSTDFRLSPCPAYDEFVGTGSTAWIATHAG
jgi:hypothetical protein